jgi:hypothetical protein
MDDLENSNIAIIRLPRVAINQKAAKTARKAPGTLPLPLTRRRSLSSFQKRDPGSLAPFGSPFNVFILHFALQV